MLFSLDIFHTTKEVINTIVKHATLQVSFPQGFGMTASSVCWGRRATGLPCQRTLSRGRTHLKGTVAEALHAPCQGCLKVRKYGPSVPRAPGFSRWI